jgi:hypothetical protein
MDKLSFEKTSEKVTREMAAQNTLLFLPENDQQSTYVQKRLFEMGFIWANDVKTVQHLKESTANGIVLKGQRIYYLSEEDTAKGYKLCALAQLDANYIAPPDVAAPPPPDRLVEMFTEVSARLLAIEDRLAKIEQHLGPDQPTTLQKPAIRRPK